MPVMDVEAKDLHSTGEIFANTWKRMSPEGRGASGLTGPCRQHNTPHPRAVQSHYVLLHLFLWQASASEPHELSESLPEEEEEEGFDVL